MSRGLKLELFLVSPFSRVLLGFQCFWDRHRSAFRMDESARHIWHVLLAYSHWHHTVGASVTSWQSRQLHDVFVHVPGDNSLWGARGEVCYTALRRLKQKSKSTQTLICSVKPSGIMGSALWHRWRDQWGRTVEGECWWQSLSYLRMKMSIMLQFSWHGLRLKLI